MQEIKLNDEKQNFFITPFKDNDYYLNNYDSVSSEESNESSAVKFDVHKSESLLYKNRPNEKLNTSVDYSKTLTGGVSFNTKFSVDNLDSNAEATRTISDFNISADFLPYHKIYFGQIRLKDKTTNDLELFNLVEGRYKLRNFESANDIDLKLVGNSSLFNYSVGAYNINTDNNLENNMITGGHTSINPLYIKPELGKFEIGTGYYTNSLANNEYNLREDFYSVFTGYKFKRFAIKGEYLRQDKFSEHNLYEDSWHLSNKVGITKNLSLKTGHKVFDDNKSFTNDIGIEYSLDKSKILNIENVKIEINASFINYGEEENARRYGIKTKYFF